MILPKIDQNTYRMWYYQLPIQYKIAAYCKNREFAALSKIIPKKSTRTLRVHSAQDFQFLHKVLNDKRYDQPYHNYYFSLAKYETGIPKLTANFRLRDTTPWKETHHHEMTSYDMLLDIDAPHPDLIWEAYDQTEALIKRIKNPFHLAFSGMGFHIRIPHKHLPEFSLDPYCETNIYQYCHALQSKLKNKFSYLDTRINDARRLCKIPYTLSIYPDKTYAVSFPFVTIEEFEGFHEKMCRIDYWLNQDIKNRKEQVIQ